MVVRYDTLHDLPLRDGVLISSVHTTSLLFPSETLLFALLGQSLDLVLYNRILQPYTYSISRTIACCVITFIYRAWTLHLDNLRY